MFLVVFSLLEEGLVLSQTCSIHSFENYKFLLNKHLGVLAEFPLNY